MEVTDKTVDEMRELHDDLKVIEEKDPDKMNYLRGIAKGIRIAAEEAANQLKPPKVTA